MNNLSWELWVALAMSDDEDYLYQFMWVEHGWLWAVSKPRMHLLKSGRRAGVRRSPLLDEYADCGLDAIDQYRPKGAADFLWLETDFSPLRFADIQRGWSESGKRLCRIRDRLFNYWYVIDAFASSVEMNFCFHEKQQVGIFESLDGNRRVYLMPLTKGSEMYQFG